MDRKLAGDEASPFLWIRIIFPEHHVGGLSCVVEMILVNNVAKKWWDEGNIFRWWYIIPSGPGVEFDLHFFSVLLTIPGVIGERSNS